MSENQSRETELERLQRELLVFLTHRIAEMGVEGQSPAVALNKAVVKAITQQNREAARLAAAELSKPLSASLSELAARLERLERRLAAGEASPALPTGPGRHRRPVTTDVAEDEMDAPFGMADASPRDAPSYATPDLADPEDLTVQPATEDTSDDSRPSWGWRSTGALPTTAIALSFAVIVIAVMGYAMLVILNQRDAEGAARRMLLKDTNAFCTIAGEAIRALPAADAPGDRASAAPTPVSPSSPDPTPLPEQERMAQAAAKLCDSGEQP